ncbi:hypothetical protein C8J56DRAFT_1173835 [Mycena floridula]|nr:hypothetical protein C8J56DRAFT_1130787 [Mycena floridula]KAJ7573352.1 hypothetical protein C8J56DRAFT_1173835 [Mycena floridula]
MSSKQANDLGRICSEFALKLHSPDGQGNALLLAGERRRKAVKQAGSATNLKPYREEDLRKTRDLPRCIPFRTIIVATSVSTRPLLVRFPAPLFVVNRQFAYHFQPLLQLDLTVLLFVLFSCSDPQIQSVSQLVHPVSHQSFGSRPLPQGLFLFGACAGSTFSGCTHRLFAIALLLSPLAGLLDTHLLVRSLKRHGRWIRGYTVAPYSNQFFSNAFTSQQALTLSALLPHPQEIQVFQVPASNSRDLVLCLGDTTLSSSIIPIIPTPRWHIRCSLCRGDKLVIRIFEFEFVLYDSSPQLTNTGFLIGDIVVRVREDSYGHSSSRISHTTHLRTSSQEYSTPTFILPTTTSTSPASPSPFGTAILTIRYVTNPDFRVDEKEGRFWREEHDGERSEPRRGEQSERFVVLIIASRSGVTWDDVDVEFAVFTTFALEFH